MNKELPFNSKFEQFRITDPYHVYEGFEYGENKAGIHTIIVDTITYLMDMFETMYVLPASDSRKMWGEYAQFFKVLMFKHVACSSKNNILLAHTTSIYNETDQIMETKVKVKGSLMNTGIESYFSNIVSAKPLGLDKLDENATPLLTFTDDEKDLGVKHVFQTRKTKESVHERMRSPLEMWNKSETFIDNNIQHVIDRLHNYYT